MRLCFQNEATEAEINASKSKVKPVGKAKSTPKAAAAKGKAVAPLQQPPPPTPDSVKKSPNPAPAKRLKGKQGQKDGEETIKELQEAVNMLSHSACTILYAMCLFNFNSISIEVCLLLGTCA